MNISEVSQMYNVSKDTLRYYEKEGLLYPITKNKSGMREYSEKDCKRLETVTFLRSLDISVKSVKNYVDLFEKGDETLEERRLILKDYVVKLEDQIKKIEHSLEILNGTIKMYDSLIVEYNKKNNKK